MNIIKHLQMKQVSALNNPYIYISLILYTENFKPEKVLWETGIK